LCAQLFIGRPVNSLPSPWRRVILGENREGHPGFRADMFIASDAERFTR
jgi:hypothetical protein